MSKKSVLKPKPREVTCVIDSVEEVEDQGPDVWKTYNDYLKRKREYKREWRKGKRLSDGWGNNSDAPTVQRRTRSPQSPYKRTAPINDNRKDELKLIRKRPPKPVKEIIANETATALKGLIDNCIADTPIEVHVDDRDVEEVTEIELEQIVRRAVESEPEQEEEPINSPTTELDDEEEILLEHPDTPEINSPTEKVEVLLSADEEFLDRWNSVGSQILSIPNHAKRMRYLSIIEGLIMEACLP